MVVTSIIGMVTGSPRSALEGVGAISEGVQLPCERPLTCKNSTMTITVEKTQNVTVKTKTKFHVHAVVLLYFLPAP